MIYGEKYAIVQYSGNPKSYVMNAGEIAFVSETAIKNDKTFRYFVSVAKARVEWAESETGRKIADNVLRQLESVLPHADTVLHAYCTGRTGSQGGRREVLSTLSASMQASLTR